MELFTSFTDVSYKHYWLRHLVLPRHRYSRYTLNFNFMPEKWYALCMTPLITTTICEKLKRRYYSIFFSERRVHLFQLISLSKSPNDNQKETENMIELELFLIVLWYYFCSACPFLFWTRHTTDWSKDYWPRLPDNSDLYWRSKVSFQSVNLYLFCPNEILQATN